MKGVLIFFGTVVVLALALVVLRGLWDGTRYAVAAAADSVHAGGFSIGGIGPKAYGPYTISGTVVMDTGHGYPPAPFIEYLDAHNATSTKQLVYYGARACNPAAGDIPCVPPYHTTDGYPAVTNGEHITVSGYIYEDRFLVTSIN